MIDSRLTTIDNPYDPFDQFDAWFAFDTQHGYNSLNLLARIVDISDELSEADQNVAIERAIEEIVTENVCGMFTKVSREVTEPFEAESVAT